MTIPISEPIPEKTIETIIEKGRRESVISSAHGGGISGSNSDTMCWDGQRYVYIPVMDKNRFGQKIREKNGRK